MNTLELRTKYLINITSLCDFQPTLQIPDQDAARRAVPGDPFTFTVDASKTGWGEVAIDVVFENRSVSRGFYKD